MRVLFVSSGNGKDGITHLVRNQGQSLKNHGIVVEFFTIKGKGFWSYFWHIFILKKYLKANSFDIIHSHYSLTSYVATLANARPLVVSLLGSDVKSNRYSRLLIKFCQKHFWDRTIVKSMDMYQCLGLKKIEIIPNGVNINRFEPLNKQDSQDKLGWDKGKKHIIFAADPDRPEKNFSLAQESIKLLQNDYEIDMHILKDVPHEDIPIYMNATDIIILSSHHEGSPNVIKEAMACNCPIVSVNVGDVKEVIGKTEGCHICLYDPVDMAEKIRQSFSYAKRTTGRNQIIDMKLDENSIAIRIVSLYKNLI